MKMNQQEDKSLDRDKLNIDEERLRNGEYYNKFSAALRDVLKKITLDQQPKARINKTL